MLATELRIRDGDQRQQQQPFRLKLVTKKKWQHSHGSLESTGKWLITSSVLSQLHIWHGTPAVPLRSHLAVSRCGPGGHVGTGRLATGTGGGLRKIYMRKTACSYGCAFGAVSNCHELLGAAATYLGVAVVSIWLCMGITGRGR